MGRTDLSGQSAPARIFICIFQAKISSNIDFFQFSAGQAGFHP
jgi:hypothetical protein